MGFIQCNVNQAMFFKCRGDDLTIVTVHVNDCTVTTTITTLVIKFKMALCEHVKVMDLGELHWLLGIEIKRDCTHHTIHLSQCSYIATIL